MKLAVFGLVVATASAFATPVTYNTIDSELCIGAAGCNSYTQVIGAITITFSPVTDTTVDPAGAFTFSTFGSIQITCTSGGTACASEPLAGLNLYINIDQVSPLADSGGIPAGVITGSISGTGSSALITWPDPAAVALAGYHYSIVDNPLALVPVTANNGITTLQGRITEGPGDVSDVPEPSTYLLFSAGLLAMGLRRRFKRAA